MIVNNYELWSLQNADFQDGLAKGKSATKALRFCLYLAIDETFQMRYQMFLQHNQFWIYQLSNLKSENTNKSPFKYGNERKNEMKTLTGPKS